MLLSVVLCNPLLWRLVKSPDLGSLILFYQPFFIKVLNLISLSFLLGYDLLGEQVLVGLIQWVLPFKLMLRVIRKLLQVVLHSLESLLFLWLDLLQQRACIGYVSIFLVSLRELMSIRTPWAPKFSQPLGWLPLWKEEGGCILVRPVNNRCFVPLLVYLLELVLLMLWLLRAPRSQVLRFSIFAQVLKGWSKHLDEIRIPSLCFPRVFTCSHLALPLIYILRRDLRLLILRQFLYIIFKIMVSHDTLDMIIVIPAILLWTRMDLVLLRVIPLKVSS